MAVRIPAKYDGTNIVEMTTGERTEWHAYIAYLYAQAPTVTLTVVSGSGTLTPGLTDTRMKAGAASQNASAFVAEGSTAEPATVTGTAYDKITGPTYNTDGSAAGDLGAVGYPLYINGDSDLQVMTQADYVDTFIYATLDAMIAASETAATNGTYTIATAASVTNYTEVSGAGTAVFIDTRADTSAYAASGIPETLDQPTTCHILIFYRGKIAQGHFHQRRVYLQTVMETFHRVHWQQMTAHSTQHLQSILSFVLQKMMLDIN